MNTDDPLEMLKNVARSARVSLPERDDESEHIFLERVRGRLNKWFLDNTEPWMRPQWMLRANIPKTGELGRSMACLLCRRNMLRVAREILHRENADAVVIGDIVGEGLSSGTEQLQTITGAVCGVPVLTPCAGDDLVQVKQEAAGLGLSYQIDTCHACGIAAQSEELNDISLGSVIEAEESVVMTSPVEMASRSEAVVIRGPGL